MFSRQFINLVMKDFGVGGSYWLSRMMPEEKLFYPSAAEAITARAQAKKKKETLMPYRTTMDLPPPVVRFRSSRTACLTLDFMPFYGQGDDEGKIVTLDLAGKTVLYDADDDSIEMLPRLTSSSKWRSPISLCVTKATANGAKDALYAINSSYSSDFQALVHCNPYGFDMRSDSDKAWHWLSLPPPPYLDHPACDDHTIQSHTLLDDGKTICFSSVPYKGGFGTYFFDTSNHQWAKAGRWVLPFHGRAVHVPGLHGLWFGIGDDQHELRAVDLSSLDGAASVAMLRPS